MRNRVAAKAGVVLALLAGLASMPAAAVSLVTNGGFETGTFSGWTAIGFNPLNILDNVAVSTDSAHSGTFGAFFGTVGTPGAIGAPIGLSQSLATVSGTSYVLDFWLQNEADPFGAVTPNSVLVKFGTSTALTLTNSPVIPYTHFLVTLPAISSATLLSFSFVNDPAFWDLDDVAVNAVTAAVPEPETWAMLGLGLLALGTWRRRKSARR